MGGEVSVSVVSVLIRKGGHSKTGKIRKSERKKRGRHAVFEKEISVTVSQGKLADAAFRPVQMRDEKGGGAQKDNSPGKGGE